MTVSLVCSDDIYRRALALELSPFGVICDFSYPSDSSPVCDYAILDASAVRNFAFPYKFYASVPSLIFGFEDELASVPSDILSLFTLRKRPLSISDLLECTLGTPENEINSGEGFRRVSSPADRIVLSESKRTVYYRGEPIDLSEREFDLLRYLIDNKGTVLSREKILKYVWANTGCENEQVVDVYIRYLRAKLDDRFSVKLIKSVRGVGYTVPKETR